MPEPLLAAATQFPERCADSKLRSFVLLLLVVTSTLLVGTVAAAMIVIPVGFVFASFADPNATTGIGPIAFWIIIGFGVLGVVLSLPNLIYLWAISDDVVLRAATARPSSSLAAQTAQNVVAEVAVAAGIAAPRTRFIAGSTPTAMAVGSGPETATVALTPSLVDALDRQQLQAVVAHEIAHIVNGDIRFKTFLSAIFVRFSAISSVLWADGDSGGPVDWLERELALALRICGALARITGLAAARQRELLADYTAVRLTRDPLALIEALQTLAERNPSAFGTRSDPLAQLCIVDPHGGSGKGRYATHPPLEKRIAQLRALDAEMKRG